MRIYIIAGEASGDLHGGNLVRELKRLDPAMEIRAWGGDRMASAGAEVVKHIRDLAFMGFTEVLLNLRTILRNIRECKQDIAAWKPDAVILVDYPGFNLRMAEYAHGMGIKVFYYISPQLWAWKAGRVEKVRRFVDRMFVILPFERDWYAERGVDVEFVGHPLMDEMAAELARPPEPLPVVDDPRPVVALLPGSREQEVSRMLPLMLTLGPAYPDHRFIVAGASSLPEAYYRALMAGDRAELVMGRTHDVVRRAEAALVTSGTATLETALLGVPEVVCYRGGAISYWIARRVVQVPFISLVNLIMGREVVKELVQKDLSERNLRRELDRILNDAGKRERIMQDLADLRERVGGAGASAKVAHRVWKSLRDPT